MKVLEDFPHAKLSASSADRWLKCPGSVAASEGRPDRPSEEAAEGTVAHYVASEVLKNNTGLRSEAHKNLKGFDGQRYRANGYTITVDLDMLDAVKVYVDTVRDDRVIDDDVYIERNLTPYLKRIHPDFGGISDAIIVQQKRGRMRVYDYKHGQGVFVSAEDNRQLKYYALGCLLALPSSVGIHVVELVVVQPRCDQGGDVVRRWTFSTMELLEYEVELLEGAERTEAEGAPLAPGEWCRWCKAKATCEALKQAEDYISSEEAVSTEVVTLGSKGLQLAIPPEKLAKAVALIPALETRIKELRKLEYEYLNAGVDVPGRKLVPKRALRKYTDQERAEELFKGDAKAWTKPMFKSVAQLEKALGRKAFAEVDAEHGLVSKVSSGYTVVEESDKRSAVKVISSDDFHKLD